MIFLSDPISNKIYRSRAPVRISFAGGGTDLPPYCFEYGGHVISTTINKYIYCSVEFNNSKFIKIYAYDLEKFGEFPAENYQYDGSGDFDIIKAVLNRFKRILRPARTFLLEGISKRSG